MAKYIYGVTPLPTLPNVNPALASNWFGGIPNLSNQNTSTVRMDHSITERDRFFGRYSNGNSTSGGAPTSSSGPPTLDGSTNATYRQAHTQSAVVSWTHTFSPTFFLCILRAFVSL